MWCLTVSVAGVFAYTWFKLKEQEAAKNKQVLPTTATAADSAPRGGGEIKISMQQESKG